LRAFLPRPLAALIAAVHLVAACLVLAHSSAHGQRIFTCVDDKGRKLTADRPIVECIDREQKEISPSGTVVRRIGPSLTAKERAAEDERARKATEERNRLAEEKRRNRALLNRYPDQKAHDKERIAALATADAVITAADRRLQDLDGQRTRLAQELEFYKGDLSKAPPVLRRQSEEIARQAQAQKRFIADQHDEKKRITARYDEELVRLKALWAQHAAPPPTAQK